MARALTGDIVSTFLKDWPLFLGVVLAIVAASALSAGCQPAEGAAGDDGGVGRGAGRGLGDDGDVRRLRRRCAAGGLHAIPARRAGGGGGLGRGAHLGRRIGTGHARSGVVSGHELAGFVATLAIAGVGGAIGHLLRIPAGALLVPMLAGAVLEARACVAIVLPPWLLAVSYAFLGWSVGLGFTRDILLHASRALPQVLLAIFVMIGVGGVLALVLVYAAGIDPLTAYLATSPGGMDSVAIIAASSQRRYVVRDGAADRAHRVVLFAGPALARFISQRMT